MNPKHPLTFIFIGRSGSGKGTQAELLISYLKNTFSNQVFYLESGEKFRDFVSSSSYTATLASEYMNAGKLQPTFLATHIWSHLMIEQMKADKHLVVDGNPRSLLEAQVLDTAFKFYDRVKPVIVYVNVSREWAVDKLTKRGRGDDKTLAGINKRLDWFDRDVMSAVVFYKKSKDYNFLDINGEQTVEEVHAEIMKKIKI